MGASYVDFFSRPAGNFYSFSLFGRKGGNRTNCSHAI
jgi:hypothetical protein